MEKVVLTIGGLLKTITWSDLFFFCATLILVLLLVYIVYLIKNDDEEIVEPVNQMSSVKKESLEDIVNRLETEYEPEPIDLSNYEKEQEKSAIISYEELVKSSKNNISYEDEYDSGYDDITVKKVDLTNTSNTQELVNLPKAIMMSYENEEAFLKALKVLQNNLVR